MNFIGPRWHSDTSSKFDSPDVYDGAKDEVDRRYTGDGYRSSGVVASVRPARDTDRERTWRADGFDWDISDVMNYVEPNEYSDFRPLCFFLVESQVGREIFSDISQMTVYRALNMLIAQ